MISLLRHTVLRPFGGAAFNVHDPRQALSLVWFGLSALFSAISGAVRKWFWQVLCRAIGCCSSALRITSRRFFNRCAARIGTTSMTQVTRCLVRADLPDAIRRVHLAA